MTGPPLSISMDFIAGGLVEMIGGSGVGGRPVRATRGGRRSCSAAPGWRRTGCCARARVWRDRNTDEVRGARSGTPTTRTGSPSTRPAARSCGCSASSGWTIDRFIARRTRLHAAAVRGDAAARAAGAVEPAAIVAAANVVVFWSLADAAADGTHRPRPQRSCSRRPPSGTSMIAFGGLNWALDGAAAPVAAVLRLEARDGTRRRAASSGDRHPAAAGLPARRSASATSPSPTRPAARRRCSTASTSRSPPARRSPSSARTAPARRRSPSCCAGSTTRSRGAIEVDGIDLRELDLGVVAVARHRRVPGLHPLRAAAARQRRAGGRARRRDRWPRSTPGGRRRPGEPRHRRWPRATTGGTDLSGGQWQRVALARALCAVQLGAGVVLLDEPTAQLDVRGEAEIFERILAATRALHDDPHLAPLLDGPPRRPHLRARARAGRRARHARRADGAGRPLPHDVRPAGPALRGRRAARTRRGWRLTSSPDAQRTATTDAAAGALVDVAAVQARLPARAAA